MKSLGVFSLSSRMRWWTAERGGKSSYGSQISLHIKKYPPPKYIKKKKKNNENLVGWSDNASVSFILSFDWLISRLRFAGYNP